MPHRTFSDADGRRWEVWSVVPGDSEALLTDPKGVAVVKEDELRERRRSIDERWATGWLAFHGIAERRRLAPIPDSWADLDDAELARLCEQAVVVSPPRRLIE